MPVHDLLARVRRLVRIPESALAELLSDGTSTWDPHKENTARLLEIQSYQLDLEWASRTTDPNDPEVKRERIEAERNGIKPPKHPIVPPIALRPNSLAEARFEAYLEQITAQTTGKRESQLVGTDEWETALGLNA